MTCAYDVEPFFLQWNRTWRIFILAGVGVFAFLAVALYIVLRGLSRPMERLAKVAGCLAKGEYTARSVGYGRDEVGQLARALNEMACCVQENIRQLEESAQRKQQLVDNVAHELRTPLTAIGGYAEYIQRAELSPKEKYEATNYIISETKRLAAMSERLLQMAALRDEQAELRAVDVSDLIDTVYLTLEPKAHKRGVCLKKSMVTSSTIWGERALLESLFLNLTDNALKACNAGGVVQLGAEHLDDEIRCWVSDTGCGMDETTLKCLGEPFFRPDKARSREQGGAGLGISLCKVIAKAHNARLCFESKPGSGTVVSVFFTTQKLGEEKFAIKN